MKNWLLVAGLVLAVGLMMFRPFSFMAGGDVDMHGQSAWVYPPASRTSLWTYVGDNDMNGKVFTNLQMRFHVKNWNAYSSTDMMVDKLQIEVWDGTQWIRIYTGDGSQKRFGSTIITGDFSTSVNKLCALPKPAYFPNCNVPMRFSATTTVPEHYIVDYVEYISEDAYKTVDYPPSAPPVPEPASIYEMVSSMFGQLWLVIRAILGW